MASDPFPQDRRTGLPDGQRRLETQLYLTRSDKHGGGVGLIFLIFPWRPGERGGRCNGLKNMCCLGRPAPREPPKSAGNEVPGPPDIVEQAQEILGFRNRGGGPVDHPQGVQGRTLIFNIKYLTKASHI